MKIKKSGFNHKVTPKFDCKCNRPFSKKIYDPHRMNIRIREILLTCECGDKMALESLK